ncbi:Retrotransposable element Tf2 [Cucumis melo var. makuwa]|uniref:Retrotransposable element Tf2 n=1 Tax=Cucumis melo var. makuwa TaxID=1194695 RepID=A0A5A7TJ13_CUCMM|nr:Retrotransposable element Tf2 [Cucumis melo var. makuwa]TYK29368.1 Retrotransposable element Tf2 [Cucumis melo var. makuwa]
MTPGFAVGSSDRSKYKKLEIPVFNGENPETWIYRAEHYFDINELADEEKVKVVVVSFGLDEVNCFCRSNNRKKVKSWEDLKRRMFEHFKTPGEGSLGARLIRIKQDHRYGDYLKKFLEYSAPLSEMVESVLIDAFITGLETNLQAEVKSRHSVTLEECMREAQMVAIPIKGNFVKREPQPPVKRLSDSEFRARLDKGLYFCCNDKYSPGHRCKGVVKELTLPLERKNKFGVTISGGTALEGNGICKTVEHYRIYGNPLVVYDHSVHGWNVASHIKEKDQGFLIEFQKIEIEVDSGVESEKEEEGEESKLPMIRNLLARNRSIFELPKGLPPKRAVDHRIMIPEGQNPINVRPYKYGYIQKGEIERLVSEMLQAGIIRPSRSPYSSPMLLVKKRDGGWRFCVDYRKLNQVTVVDKFPISVIKELLDELHRAEDNRLFANEKKCVIGHSRVNYLGHWISKKWVEADGEKVMVNWPQPTNVSKLRGFLGLTRYYRRFVKNYGNIATLLTKLLQKNGFHWCDDATIAFELLKQAMISVPVLSLPNFSLPFIIETDASGTEVAPLRARQKIHDSFRSEGLEILNGTKGAADALSRVKLPAELNSLRAHGLLDIEIVTTEVEKDEELQDIINILKENPEGKANYQWKSGNLLYKGRLVMSKNFTLIPSLLHTFHDSVLGGHLGFLKTYKRMNGEIHWMGMKNDVKKYVEQCEICQRNKTEALAPAGLLQPLPLPNLILEDWTMDFIEGLPKAGGYDSIMVIVDRLSKMAHFITLKHPFTAKQVAEKFVEEIISKHGIPNSIVTDRDKIFLNHFWKELFTAMGTSLKRSTAFHPQTDGQTERADLHRRELKFRVGDEVYLKLRPYRQRSLAQKCCEKLTPKFYEPYRIIEEMGEVAYRLNLPPGAIIHNGLPDSDVTWESVYAMNQQYPSFHLEDKRKGCCGGCRETPGSQIAGIRLLGRVLNRSIGDSDLGELDYGKAEVGGC